MGSSGDNIRPRRSEDNSIFSKMLSYSRSLSRKQVISSKFPAAYSMGMPSFLLSGPSSDSFEESQSKRKDLTIFYGGNAHVFHNIQLDEITANWDPATVSSTPVSKELFFKQEDDTYTCCLNGMMVTDGHSVDEVKLEEPIDEAIHEDVPGYLQDCVDYCSLFPVDRELTRQFIICFWLAAGFIGDQNNDEELAINCFNRLIERELIVHCGWDSSTSERKYKLGNCSKSHSCKDKRSSFAKVLDDDTDFAHLEHLSLTEIDQSHFKFLRRCSNLKTLLLHKCDISSVKELLGDVFKKLKFLTTLGLACTNIVSLPESVGKLSSLKCLDVSWTPIESLPMSIVSLSNLETLILVGCRSLSGFQNYLPELTNLQHLAMDLHRYIDEIPLGIGKLTKLQSWPMFSAKSGYGIVELSEMNRLRGGLSIYNLEDIKEKEAAERSYLCKKVDVTDLDLFWGLVPKDMKRKELQVEVLDSLRPHFDLQRLKIGFYSGRAFPSWISDPSFTRIVEICLSHCNYCEVMPSLGDLPSLKSLRMDEMGSVVHIDESFCHKQAINNNPAFPRLEKLEIVQMSSLVDWRGVIDGDFPRLLSLMLFGCPKLVFLQCLTFLDSLQYLEVTRCPGLAFLPLPESLKELYVSDCPNLLH